MPPSLHLGSLQPLVLSMQFPDPVPKVGSCRMSSLEGTLSIALSLTSDRVTEAQRGKATWPKSHRRQRQSHSRAPVFLLAFFTFRNHFYIQKPDWNSTSLLNTNCTSFMECVSCVPFIMLSAFNIYLI